MTLRPLKSSTVESAGFEDGKIRVLFLSGHWHDYAEQTAEVFEEFLAAPSPGRFVRERLVGRPAASTGPRPLDTYEPDECCSSKLARALRSNKLEAADAVFECPTCSTEWVGEPTAAGRHWKPRVWARRI